MITETIHVRVKSDIKARAMSNAEEIGIPLSSIINAFLVKFANSGSIEFSVPKTPNAETMEAIRELEEGKGTFSSSLSEMYKDMGITR